MNTDSGPIQAYSNSVRELYKSIPEGWTARRLKYLASIRFSNVDKKSDPKQQKVLLCNYIDVYRNNFISNSIDFMKATADIDEIAKFSLRQGDVIITKDSETPDDIGVPALVLEGVPPLVCGYHLAILRSGAALKGEFLFRSLQSRQNASFFERRANGITRFAIGMDTVGSCPIVYPPMAIQETICSFLRKETSRIDSLIAKKERQIELLQEKRQTIITRAVTKGLDSNAKMKDSGVPWIGEIPEDWTMMRLKNVTPEVTVGIVVNPSAYYEDEGILCLRSLNISSGQLDLSSPVFISPKSNELHRKSKLHAGDIVVIRTGKAGMPLVISPDLEGVNCIDLLIIRRSSKFLSHYLRYFLLSDLASFQVQRDSVGAIQSHFNTSTLAELLVPLPTLPAQQRLLAGLDRQISDLDTLVAKVSRSVELLQEYRSSLITAAVSGQIDIPKMTQGASE